MFHRGTMRDPGVQPTFQGPHAAEAAVNQQAGDTRRAGFIGSTAINHHVAVRWYPGQC